MIAIKEKKRAQLEAMLFTASKPLDIKELEKALKLKASDIEILVNGLEQKFSGPESGIELSRIGGYKLIVKGEHSQTVAHLTPHADLSRGLLRVLAIIAYKEPIAQSAIVKVIGNRTYEYIKELEQRSLIKYEKKSRTKILSTTPHFEQYFGVRKEELKNISEAQERTVQERAQAAQEQSEKL